MAYKQQAMDFKWQIARKIDRLDLGTFAALEFFYRNSILFGIVRAMDPEEPDRDSTEIPGKTVADLIKNIDERINDLLDYDTTAILMGKSNLQEVREFQKISMSAYYEIAEVIYRCKLTDGVRVQEQEAP